MNEPANFGVPNGVPFGPITLELFLALLAGLAVFFWVYYRRRAKQAKAIRQRFLEIYADADLRRHGANVAVVYKVVGVTRADLCVTPVWNRKPLGSGSSEYTLPEDQLVPLDREAFLAG